MGAPFPGPTAGPRRVQADVGTPRSEEQGPRRVRIAEDGVNPSVPAIVCEQECRGVGPPNVLALQLRADAALVSLPRARQLDARVGQRPPPIRMGCPDEKETGFPAALDPRRPLGGEGHAPFRTRPRIAEPGQSCSSLPLQFR